MDQARLFQTQKEEYIIITKYMLLIIIAKRFYFT